MQKSVVTRCKIRSLLVAENHSLLAVKFARYSVEVASCKKSLVARCKICSLLVVEIARSKNYLVFRCKIPSIFIAKNHSLLKQGPTGIIFCLKSAKLEGSFSLFNIISPSCSSQHITQKSVVTRTLSNATIYKRVKIQQLVALSQRNEKDLIKHSNCFSTCAR